MEVNLLPQSMNKNKLSMNGTKQLMIATFILCHQKLSQRNTNHKLGNSLNRVKWFQSQKLKQHQNMLLQESKGTLLLLTKIQKNIVMLMNLIGLLVNLIDINTYIEDEELHIILQKAFKGELWPCVFKGHNKIDPIVEGELQKKLLLERFQEEHPGFDFSQAQFNGQAPDARNFMGGIKYN